MWDRHESLRMGCERFSFFGISFGGNPLENFGGGDEYSDRRQQMAGRGPSNGMEFLQDPVDRLQWMEEFADNLELQIRWPWLCCHLRDLPAMIRPIPTGAPDVHLMLSPQPLQSIRMGAPVVRKLSAQDSNTQVGKKLDQGRMRPQRSRCSRWGR